MAATVLALAKTAELDLSLIKGNRGVLVDMYSVPLLLDGVDQDEGVARRLEVIEVGPVSDLASEVLIAAPQDGG